MAPPSTSSANVPIGSNFLLLPRQNPKQPELCPSPTTAWGPLGPTPSTTYIPCHSPQSRTPSCSGLPKGSVVALTVTIPLVLTCVAFIACAIAYYRGNNSNYNSGCDDGREMGRREVQKKIEREKREMERDIERRKEEREREREREKIWGDWRRTRVKAVARNAAAANNRPATNLAAAAQIAFRTDRRADEPVSGRRDSSSRPQPEGRRLGSRYWTSPFQHHPPTSDQPGITKPPTRTTYNRPCVGPSSRRSASTSRSQNPRPGRNAVPLFSPSRGTSQSSRRKPRVASVSQLQASTATNRATPRAIPQTHRFAQDELRRGSSRSGRPERMAAMRSPRQVGARGRGGSVGGAEEHGEESRSQKELESSPGHGGRGLASEGNEILPRGSPVLGFGARSRSLRSGSESPPGSPRSRFPEPGLRPLSRGSERSSVVRSEERGRDEDGGEWGVPDEARWSGLGANGTNPHASPAPSLEAGSSRGESPSPRSRSSSRGERSPPRIRSPSPRSHSPASAAGSEERGPDEEDRERGPPGEGNWPGSDAERDGKGRSLRSHSPWPLASPRNKSSSHGKNGASTTRSEKRRGKEWTYDDEERAPGSSDAGQWPGSQGYGNEKRGSSPLRQRDGASTTRSERASTTRSEKRRGKEWNYDEKERASGNLDEAGWPGSQGGGNEERRSRSPSPGVGIRDV